MSQFAANSLIFPLIVTVCYLSLDFVTVCYLSLDFVA